MSRLYLECTSGISGDMFVAALLDLGADEQVLRKALESLPVSGFSIRISRVKKSGLDACDFDVVLDKEHENHDHDMEYLYEEKEACREHHHHHEHRGLPQILEMIEQAEISERAKRTASKIFRILAQAEAKVHGTEIEDVHFHEVGAVDSIADIVAAAVCLDNLDIEEAVVPVLYEGQGTVRCQHGILPVPVPAVTEIVKTYGLPLHIIEERGEFVTPTGAAIAACIRTGETLPGQFQIERTGMGAGKRKHGQSGILRAMIIEEIR